MNEIFNKIESIQNERKSRLKTLDNILNGVTDGSQKEKLFEINEKIINLMRGVGHEVELVPSFSSIMGHAGAVVRHENGTVESANDPRSDGWAYAC